MDGYILDTVIFNRVMDGGILLPELDAGIDYFATHVQLDELAATRDETRRNHLLRQFSTIDPEAIPTESLVLGVSRLGLAKLSDGILFSQIRSRLDEKNGGKPNNAQDALIAETAINNGLTLVTEDGDLLDVVSQQGGLAVRIGEIDPAGPSQPPSRVSGGA